MLVELELVEQRYHAVLEVLDGVPVTEVARRNGVARQTVHDWCAGMRSMVWRGWGTGRRGRRRARIRCLRRWRPGWSRCAALIWGGGR